MICTSGGWLKSGVFVHAPPLPRDVLERLFQHRVFRLLLDEGAVSADIVEDMLQWHPTGFDAYIGHEIYGQDKQALEHLAEYLAEGPVSLDKLDYTEGTGNGRAGTEQWTATPPDRRTRAAALLTAKACPRRP